MELITSTLSYLGSHVIGLVMLQFLHAIFLAVCLGREPTLLGKRVPTWSFLLALLLTESPFWLVLIVKGFFLGSVWISGGGELWWYQYLVFLASAISVLLVYQYFAAAFEAKKTAERAVALFSEEGSLNEKDGLHHLENPFKLIWNRTLFHLSRPCEHYGKSVPLLRINVAPNITRSTDVEAFRDIVYASESEMKEAGAQSGFLKLDIYKSKTGVSTTHQVNSKGNLKPVVIYFHGGAWMKGLGDKSNRLPFVYNMAQLGWVSVSINYRLYPSNYWPDYIVDCKRAIRWVKENINKFGGDPSFIIVSGGSAGGHLASLLAISGGQEYKVPEWQPSFESIDTSVQGCVAWYPACDTSDEWWSKYTGKSFDSNEHKKASPVHHVMKVCELVRSSKSLHKLCPFLIIQPEADSLCPAPWVRRFYRELASHPNKTSKVEYVEFPNSQHGFDNVCSPRSYYATAVACRFCNQAYNAAR